MSSFSLTVASGTKFRVDSAQRGKCNGVGSSVKTLAVGGPSVYYWDMKTLSSLVVAVLLISGCADHRRSVPALIKALKSPKPEVRADAAARLGLMGDQAAPAVPGLIDVLKDRQVSVFRAAGDALVSLGELSRPGLTALSREAPSWLKCRAVETLGRLPSSAASVPVFLEALEDHDSCVHAKAADALARAGDPAVPAVVTLLKDPNPVLRRAASDVLGRMPSEARDRAAFPLVEQLRKGDDYSRGEAEILLGELGRPAVASLVEFLTDKDVDLRRRATSILGRIGASVDGAVEGLLLRLDDEDRMVRLKAAMSLGQIGERDESVLPLMMMRLARETSPRMRRGLVASLGNMGPAAEDAVDTLMGLLNDADAEVQEEASESLMKIGTMRAMDAVERRNRSSSR
jgi:HEAT repeat protein